MVIRTKTKQEIHEWFGAQWTAIVQQFPAEYEAGELSRMEKMFRGLAGRSEIEFQNRFQEPYTFYLPDLPTQMFFTNPDFPVVEALEKNFLDIKEELVQLLEMNEANEEFKEYLGDGVNSDKSLMTNMNGQWNVFYFWQQFMLQEQNAALCPKTFAVLENLRKQGSILSGMVCFSSLMPGTTILPHTGPSNMRLTCHLGLIGCDQVKLTVGSEFAFYEEGKCLVFDDSFVHKVQHQGPERRITLMLDIWHPAMSAIEIQVFSQVMQNSATFMHPDEFFHSLKLVRR